MTGIGPREENPSQGAIEIDAGRESRSHQIRENANEPNFMPMQVLVIHGIESGKPEVRQREPTQFHPDGEGPNRRPGGSNDRRPGLCRGDEGGERVGVRGTTRTESEAPDKPPEEGRENRERAIEAKLQATQKPTAMEVTSRYSTCEADERTQTPGGAAGGIVALFRPRLGLDHEEHQAACDTPRNAQSSDDRRPLNHSTSPRLAPCLSCSPEDSRSSQLPLGVVSSATDALAG